MLSGSPGFGIGRRQFPWLLIASWSTLAIVGLYAATIKVRHGVWRMREVRMSEPGPLSRTARLCFGSLLLAIAVLTIVCTDDRNAQSSDAAAQSAGRSEGVNPRAAAFAGQTVPAAMVADQNYLVSVRIRTTGTAAWSAAENYRLGSVNPPDNEVWGFRRVAVPVVVAPGAGVPFVAVMLTMNGCTKITVDPLTEVPVESVTVTFGV